MRKQEKNASSSKPYQRMHSATENMQAKPENLNRTSTALGDQESRHQPKNQELGSALSRDKFLERPRTDLMQTQGTEKQCRDTGWMMVRKSSAPTGV